MIKSIYFKLFSLLLQFVKEIRLLIDRYVSEQNALGSRYGMLAYLLGYSDCKEMLLEKRLFAKPQQAT